MKKVIALLLALLLVTAMFGCTKQKVEEEEDPNLYQTDDGNWSEAV